MKACFYLQRRFAYIGHEILCLLKERGVTEACAYVATRESYEFLKSQKDIPYTSLILDEDIHEEYKNEDLDMKFLRNLEKEYGLPTLWNYIENDRIIRYNQLVREYPFNTPQYSHEDILKIVQVTAKRVIEFLDREKPDFLVYTVVAGIGPMLLFHIAKKRRIKTLVIRATRIGSGHVATSNYDMFDELPQPSEESLQKARLFLEKFRNKPAPYTALDSQEERPLTRNKQFAFLSPSKLLYSLSWQLQVWTSHMRSASRNDYSTITPWNMLIDRARRKLRILYGFDNLYEAPRGETYIYYPLHMEPEIATMLLAPVFNDQLWVIKQIARSLPVGYKVYVKEHMAMFGFRTRAFYKELKKIPNVRLISHHASSFDLIQKSKLVAVLTGTAAWEALLLRRPAITFGDVYFNILSGVKRCHDIENLPNLIQSHLESFVHNEEELVQFVASLLHDSVPLDLADIWQREQGSRIKERQAELVPIADLIIKKVRA